MSFNLRTYNSSTAQRESQSSVLGAKSLNWLCKMIMNNVSITAPFRSKFTSFTGQNGKNTDHGRKHHA